MWPRRLFAPFPRAVVVVLALAFLITLPSLGLGLRADDHWQAALLSDDPELAALHPAPWDVFRFFDGDVSRTKWFSSRGFIPWWTDLEVRISFLRPLASVTHWLDAWLGLAPWLRHLHSSFWYVACVAAALAAYRRLLGSSLAAGLAGAFFALDYGHGLAVGWLAQRNSMVAAVFACLAVAVHHRGVEGGRRGDAWLTGLCVLLALLGGESGLGALGYLAAYAVTLDKRPLRARLVSLVPAAFAFVAWVVAYRAGGYGARHSGLYLDVVTDAPAFLLSVVRHVPMLLASELGFVGPDLVAFLPLGAQLAFLALSLGTLAVAWVSTRDLLREDARARFFLLGATLALVPACAMTLVSSRLTFGASLGLFGFLGLAVGRYVDRTPGASRLARAWLAWNLVGHLVLSPLVFQLAARQMVFFERTLVKVFTGPAVVLPGQRVVFVNPAEPTFLSHAWLGARAAGLPVPDSFFALANGTNGVVLRRESDRTLVLRYPQGFGSSGTDALFRARPMPVGSRVEMGGARFTVIETGPRGLATAARLELAVPLDDPRLVWIVWDGEKPRRFDPPKVGDEARIEPVLTLMK